MLISTEKVKIDKLRGFLKENLPVFSEISFKKHFILLASLQKYTIKKPAIRPAYFYFFIR